MNLDRKDFYGGGLMVLIGLATAVQGWQYQVGTLTRMGPGFLPVSLGTVLALLGISIVLSGVNAAPDGETAALKFEWLGWGAILAGPVLFIILGRYGGMVPATFGCVFVSALGDRSSSWKGALALALGVTLFGVILFSYVLSVPFPLWRWG